MCGESWKWQKVKPDTNDSLYTEARALAALIVHEASHLSLTELGKCLNRNVAPLSRAVQLLAKKTATDPVLAERVEDVRRELEMAESQA